MKTIEEINKKFVAAVLDTNEQYQDGLISKKEGEDQISCAYADMVREMERIKEQ